MLLELSTIMGSPSAWTSRTNRATKLFSEGWLQSWCSFHSSFFSREPCSGQNSSIWKTQYLPLLKFMVMMSLNQRPCSRKGMKLLFHLQCMSITPLTTTMTILMAPLNYIFIPTWRTQMTLEGRERAFKMWSSHYKFAEERTLSLEIRISNSTAQRLMRPTLSMEASQQANFLSRD